MAMAEAIDTAIAIEAADPSKPSHVHDQAGPGWLCTRKCCG